MLAIIILVVVFCLLIGGMVAFNLLTKNKGEQEVSTPEVKKQKEEEPKETVENKQEEKPKRQRKTKVDNEKIKDLFNKKDESKKKQIVCSSCGSSFEAYNGNGRCPYCGAKVIKK